MQSQKQSHTGGAERAVQRKILPLRSTAKCLVISKRTLFFSSLSCQDLYTQWRSMTSFNLLGISASFVNGYNTSIFIEYNLLLLICLPSLKLVIFTSYIYLGQYRERSSGKCSSCLVDNRIIQSRDCFYYQTHHSELFFLLNCVQMNTYINV